MREEDKSRLVRDAHDEAVAAVEEGNPPFGAVLSNAHGEVLFRAHNTQNTDCDPTAHAEINLLRRAARRLETRRLRGYVLFANAEPCPMCMAAIIKAGIEHVVYGAPQESDTSLPLSAAEIASRSRARVVVEGGYLGDHCKRQVAQGRLTLAAVQV